MNKSDYANQLESQVSSLQTELKFYKSISEFSESVVGNMCVKIKDGHKIWIDRLKGDITTLQSLDEGSDILHWLDEIQGMKHTPN